MDAVNEQLYHACKMALAAIEVQRTLAMHYGQEVINRAGIMNAGQLLIDVMEVIDGKPVNGFELILWGAEQLNHQQVIQDENDTNEPPVDLDPGVWG